MSCPDWRHLVAEREAGAGDAGPAWAAARQHLCSCPRCREVALAADPTLIFLRLPAPTVPAAEVTSMQQGVAAMIRASRVRASGVTTVPAGRLFDPRPAHRLGGAMRWARPAAAAALFAIGVLQAPVARESVAKSFIARSPASSLVETGSGRSFPAVAASTGSILEDLDLPDARVYEVASEEMQVVMVVDSSLDL